MTPDPAITSSRIVELAVRIADIRQRAWIDDRPYNHPHTDRKRGSTA
ncbi:hypothetical protein OUQ49_33085 [Streptomyces cavourensis]|nr:hypothetical protein [Streptomyces cavourensis]WAE64231.1 hypothetical protein OUQ49_00010 [Streptomyces cavourensis]WAE70233.1 hypothetical protein OUQ49_33085 [Streptomyces cavourensis]